MGHRCCGKQKVKRGLWSPEEDEKLLRYITLNGHSSWSSVPKLAGLQRCGKSCRLRWINYLRPDLKRGSFTAEEEQIIIDVHRILGNRWAQIAKHLPGRTDNEVKNFWNSCIKKKLISQGLDPTTHNLIMPSHKRSASSSSPSSNKATGNNKSSTKSKTKQPLLLDHDHENQTETFSIITLNPPKDSSIIKTKPSLPSYHSNVTTASNHQSHTQYDPAMISSQTIPSMTNNNHHCNPLTPCYASSSTHAAMLDLLDESWFGAIDMPIDQQFQASIQITQTQEHGDTETLDNINHNKKDQSTGQRVDDHTMDVLFDSSSFDPDFAALFSSAMSSDFNPMEWTFN